MAEVIRGATTDSSSWQERLIEASLMGVIRIQGHVDVDIDDATTTTEIFGGGPGGPTIFDNTSSQCSSPGMFCMPCDDDKPLWWLVLQWLKMMLFKVARSYTGKPILLMVLPLSVGLCIGYLIGRNHSTTTTTTTTKCSRQQIQRNESSLLSMALAWLSNLISFFYVTCIYPLLMMRKDHNIMLQPNVHFDVQTGKKKHEEISSSSSSGNSSLTKVEMEELAAAEIRLKRDDPNLIAREETVRTNMLRSEDKDDATTSAETTRYIQQESGIDPSRVPRHVAVIMDGNRRYGRETYGNATRGHWDGSSKLVDFARWCIAEHVSVLTVYAFSTENWNRQPDEVAALMSIFTRYCDELRVEALKRNIKILVLSTDAAKIPSHVQLGMERMVKETENCNGLTMNICISYGSRGEIVAASKSLAADVARGDLDYHSIDEIEFQKRLLTSHCGDPDVLIRTSGEIRISNFLLWQLAYTEMFFVDKPWPAIEKDDLIEVIKAFAGGRKRRFGI